MSTGSCASYYDSLARRFASVDLTQLSLRHNRTKCPLSKKCAPFSFPSINQSIPLCQTDIVRHCTTISCKQHLNFTTTCPKPPPAFSNVPKISRKYPKPSGQALASPPTPQEANALNERPLFKRGFPEVTPFVTQFIYERGAIVLFLRLQTFGREDQCGQSRQWNSRPTKR